MQEIEVAAQVASIRQTREAGEEYWNTLSWPSSHIRLFGKSYAKGLGEVEIQVRGATAYIIERARVEDWKEICSFGFSVRSYFAERQFQTSAMAKISEEASDNWRRVKELIYSPAVSLEDRERKSGRKGRLKVDMAPFAAERVAAAARTAALAKVGEQVDSLTALLDGDNNPAPAI